MEISSSNAVIFKTGRDIHLEKQSGTNDIILMPRRY